MDDFNYMRPCYVSYNNDDMLMLYNYLLSKYSFEIISCGLETDTNMSFIDICDMDEYENIIKDGNKIFATQRGYGEFKDGWEFPGGKVEPNETSRQAIVREIKEELDTTIQVKEYFDTVEYDYPNFHLSMECFICTILEGKLTLLEHESAKWLTKETLDSVDWLPADLGLIKKLKDIL